MANEYAVVHVATSKAIETEEHRLQRLQRDQLKKINVARKAVSKTAALALATATMVNSAVGSYTGNKLRQSNIQTLITLGGIATTAIVSPTAAAIAATTFAIKSAVDYEIRMVNSRQESNFKRSYRGNMTTSGSRWRGYK